MRLFLLICLVFALAFGGASVHFALQDRPLHQNKVVVTAGNAIRLLPAKGQSKTLFTANAKITGLLWSPDGEQIAYLIKDGLFLLTNLDARRPQSKLLSAQFDSNNVHTMGWTPNSRELMVQLGDAVWFLDVATTKAQKMTGFSTPVWHPAISPDGGQIVYSDGNILAGGEAKLYIASRDAKNAAKNVKLLLPTSTAKRNGMPAWSPDGRYIAFFADAQLGLYDTQTSQVRYDPLTRYRPDGSILDSGHRPRWSFDSRELLLVHRSRKESYWSVGLYLVAGEGFLYNLGNGKNQTSPGWSPNEQNIIYTEGDTPNTTVLEMDRGGRKLGNLGAGQFGRYILPSVAPGQPKTISTLQPADLEAGAKQAADQWGIYFIGGFAFVMFVWVVVALSKWFKQLSPEGKTAVLVGSAAALGAIAAASAENNKKQQARAQAAKALADAQARQQAARAAQTVQNRYSQPTYQQPDEEEASPQRHGPSDAEIRRRDEEESRRRAENEAYQRQQRQNDEYNKWAQSQNQQAQDRGEPNRYDYN
jgi:hypothetical protein